MFAALLMMFGTTAMAEDVIWSEDWSSVTEDNKIPQDVSNNYTSTGTQYNEDGTFKSGTKIYVSSSALAGGSLPELLIAKNGGTFTANIALNGKNGEMELAFKTNRSDLTVTVEGATLGTKSRTGNDDVYPLTVASGTTNISITWTQSSSSNARLDNIKLYQGTAKKPAGLSWGTSSRTVTIGSEENKFPTLSNENNLTVTYSSSEETVATIDATGVITLVAAGSTVISAAFAGNDKYEAQTVSYTLTVKENAGGGGETTTITVAKALEIIAGLEDGKTTAEEYDVKGYVVDTPDWQRKTDNSLYGNVEFNIADEANGTSPLRAYHCNNLDNAKYTEETINNFKEGDVVTIHGKLQKYVKNDVVTPEITSCYLVKIEATPTAISSVKTANEQGDVYNLQGQQVMQPTKGLYIINGKKVVIK